MVEVQENPTDKLIRTLKEENEKLKKALEGIKVLEKHGSGGRKITVTGQQDLDRIAGQVLEKSA